MTVGKLFPEAARSLFKKPATERYPFVKTPVPEGFRGAPEVDVNTCIGCKICARDCPAKAIEMVDVGVKFPRPAFHYDQCIYCAVCSDVCPKKSITLSKEFELASTVRRSLLRQPGKPAPAPEAPATGEKTE